MLELQDHVERSLWMRAVVEIKARTNIPTASVMLAADDLVLGLRERNGELLRQEEDRARAYQEALDAAKSGLPD